MSYYGLLNGDLDLRLTLMVDERPIGFGLAYVVELCDKSFRSAEEIRHRSLRRVTAAFSLSKDSLTARTC